MNKIASRVAAHISTRFVGTQMGEFIWYFFVKKLRICCDFFFQNLWKLFVHLVHYSISVTRAQHAIKVKFAIRECCVQIEKSLPAIAMQWLERNAPNTPYQQLVSTTPSQGSQAALVERVEPSEFVEVMETPQVEQSPQAAVSNHRRNNKSLIAHRPSMKVQVVGVRHQFIPFLRSKNIPFGIAGRRRSIHFAPQNWPMPTNYNNHHNHWRWIPLVFFSILIFHSQLISMRYKQMTFSGLTYFFIRGEQFL